MKIPLDFFLRLIEKFFEEQEFDNVIKKLKKHLEMPEEDFSDILSDLSLQNIISKYVKENKDLKKKLKSKSKKYLEENKVDDEEEKEKLISKKRKRSMSNAKKEEEDEEKPKKRKRTMSNAKEEEEEEKPKKKRKRTMSNAKEEKQIEEKEDKKEKSKRKRTMSSAKDEKEKSTKKIKSEDKSDDNDEDKKEKEIKKEKKKKKKNEEDDEDIDLEKEVKFIPKPKSDNNPNRIPFKRIDDSNIKHQVPENLRDNSYAAFMKQTGDDFGKAANDKLIVTRGKGFRKEKTKFKNKTFHGGMTISTTVRSIPLEDDSSSDEK